MLERHSDFQTSAPVHFKRAVRTRSNHAQRIAETVTHPLRALPTRPQTSKVKIVYSDITQVKRDRDFGRVEAWVLVAFQYDPNLPPRVEKLFTSTSARGPVRPGELRRQLIEKTVKLAVLMHRTDRGAHLKSV